LLPRFRLMVIVENLMLNTWGVGSEAPNRIEPGTAAIRLDLRGIFLGFNLSGYRITIEAKHGNKNQWLNIYIKTTL